MDLKNLIDTHLDLPRLSSDLDDLGHFGRLWSVRQWTGHQMATLWEALRDFRPTTLDDFVPASVGPLVEVIHYGKNSLPVATRFEKHFCRPRNMAGDAALVGFNAQSLSVLTGPGYFVAHPVSSDSGVAEGCHRLHPSSHGEGVLVASRPAKLALSRALGVWRVGGHRAWSVHARDPRACAQEQGMEGHMVRSGSAGSVSDLVVRDP